MQPLGRTCCIIAEGYRPSWSRGSGRMMLSHDAIMPVEHRPARRQRRTARPADGPPARRNRHIRFNDLSAPEPLPHGTSCARVVVSDEPLACQHTRLHGRQAENARMTAIPFAV